MTDLLVKLYDLEAPVDRLAGLARNGIVVRRAMASEMRHVVTWVQNLFGEGWATECEVAFARQPIGCIVALNGGRMAGFACHDATWRNFFGPIGVDPSCRHKGVGHAILLVTLHAMAQAGYAYAIVGDAGPMAFFEKCVGAFPIPGSTPGIYQAPMKKP
jgi:N-acetylglutamate synthase-like GNAT family acetyltransferase